MILRGDSPPTRTQVGRFDSPLRSHLIVVVLCMLAFTAHANPFRIAVTETQTPLAPNSVVDLSASLGYYRAAGLDVDIVHLSPLAAVAALRIGQVETAGHRYGRHEVSGTMVCLVADSSTGDLTASWPYPGMITSP